MKRKWPQFDPIWYCFDDWDVPQLRAFWSDFRLAGIAEIETLFPNDAPGTIPELTEALQTLATYAMNKSCGVELRLKGEIARAQVYEEAAEMTYEKLPEWAQW